MKIDYLPTTCSSWSKRYWYVWFFCISSYNVRVDRSGCSFVHLIDWSRPERSTSKTATYKQILDSTCVSFSKISVCVFVCVYLEKDTQFCQLLVGFKYFVIQWHKLQPVPVASTLQHTHTQQNKHLERFQPNTWISKKELNIPELFPTHSANGQCNHPKQKCQCSLS